ncbi:hypothetical protein HW555_010780, partial [Spodoptera exigua]
LDKVTRRAWELKVSSDYKEELPTFDDLKEFLVNRFRALENLETKVERVPKTTRALHVVKDKGVSCAFCAGEHRISSCPKFINESTETRRNFVLKNKLCFICLLSNHSVKFCKNTLKCQVCKRRHHTLLHSQGVFGSEVGEGSSAARAESSSVTYEGNRNANQAEGSKPHVVGVGDKGTTSTAVVVINLHSRVNPSFQIKVNAYVLKSVTSLLPSAKVARLEWVDLNDNDLADPEYFIPNRIDVLLGAEVYSQVIQHGVKKNANGTLLAQETTLGWVLSGAFEIKQGVDSHSNITVMHTSIQDDELKRGCPVYVEWEGVVGRRARANLLHKAVPLPRAAHKIALGGAAQPLSANVSAIAFAAPAQLKRRLGGPRAPAAPGAPPAEPAPSTSGAAAAPAPEDAAPTNGAVRRRAPDTLPMEVT